MRQDMSSVMYERGKYMKLMRNDRVDIHDPDLPKIGKMRRGSDSNIWAKPFIRFLESCVGKNWNSIYSDICYAPQKGQFTLKEITSWFVGKNRQFYVQDGILCKRRS